MENSKEVITEELYRVFRKYPFPTGMEGCPCCVSEDHLKLLRSKPLRQLGSEEFSRYAFKAMTTWGTETDFKYYLPRLFELYLCGGEHSDAFIILDKLSYGQWTTWPEEEQEVIRLFLRNWYGYLLNTWCFSPDTINKLRYLCGDEDLLPEPEDIDMHSGSFRNFICFIRLHFHDREAWWLREWIHDRMDIIEQAFFHFEKSDPRFAKHISDALFIVEHTYRY